MAISVLNNGADLYVRKGYETNAHFAGLKNAIRPIAQRKVVEKPIQGILEVAPLMLLVVDTERRIQALYAATSKFTSLPRREMLETQCVGPSTATTPNWSNGDAVSASTAQIVGSGTLSSRPYSEG